MTGLSGLSAFRGAAGGGGGVTDAFNRANSTTSLGTADSGQEWTADAGGWGISSNQAYCETDASFLNFATLAGAADGTLEVKLPSPGGGSGGSAWVVCRFTDVDNCLFVLCSGAEPYRLMKRQGGVPSTLDTGALAQANTDDVVKVVLSGSSIRVYVNDELEIDGASAFNETAVRVGLGTDFGAGPGSAPRFDDFSFTP
jgi:hypothetical protein